MTEQLKTMLHDAADDHPDFTLNGDPWRRGRRIRLRRRLAGVAGATVTAAAVTAGAVLLTTPELTSAPEPAQEQPAEPALPDALYEVPPNIADISDEPLGEPAAVVYRDEVRIGIYSDATRPIVVGAETGTVRAVRDAEFGNTRLSPDGTKLAVADDWHFGRRDGEGRLVPPTVYVADMITGETTAYPLPDEGLGGGVLRLTWLPDSSSLAMTAIETIEINDDGDGGSGENVRGNLDTNTGEWREGEVGTRFAFSRDARRMVVDPPQFGGPTIQNSDGSDQVDVELDGSYGVAFSPDGERVAAIARSGDGFTDSDPYLLEVFDSGTGELTTRLELGKYAYVSLVGWGERGIVIDTSRRMEVSADGIPEYGQVAERIDLTDPDNPVRTPVIEDQMHGMIDIPTAFLDANAREASPPSAGFDWIRWVPEPVVLVILGVLIAAFILIAVLTRRRRVKVGPAAVERDESGGRTDQ